MADATPANSSASRLAGSGDTIPTLARLLEQVGGPGAAADRDQVAGAIATRSRRCACAVRRALEGYRGDVAVMSFDPRVSRWFASHSPRHGARAGGDRGAATARRLARRSGVGSRCGSARPDFLAYDVRDLPSRFAAAQRARGLPLLTWTVRSAELRRARVRHADAPIAEGAGIA